MLKASFFPRPLPADLASIEGYEYPEPSECLPIEFMELHRALLKARPNKALGPDDILSLCLH